MVLPVVPSARCRISIDSTFAAYSLPFAICSNIMGLARSSVEKLVSHWNKLVSDFNLTSGSCHLSELVWTQLIGHFLYLSL